MSIALIGNPNCGKTTLFNLLTGSRQRVGNWPGVTVERKTGTFNFNNKAYEIIDLPGTYSIEENCDTTSQDEMIARNFILSNSDNLVVNIIDATNLQRSLYLTFQLIDLNVPLLVVLNMVDAMEDMGESINIDALSTQLGCPVIAISSTKKRGLAALYKQLEHSSQEQKPAKPRISTLSFKQQQIIDKFLSQLDKTSHFNRLNPWQIQEALIDESRFSFNEEELEALIQCRNELAQWCDGEIDIALASSRYEAIDQLYNEVIEKPREASDSLSDKIDKITLGRFTGIPIFLLAMYLMFIVAVKFGSVFIDFFDVLFSTIFVDGMHYLLDEVGSPDWLTGILADGLGTGIQTVSTFVPVIGAMFFCLSFLEDSGYLARAAMVIDRGMRAIGLPGKAFVPMLVGFGCGVPAIMGSRTLDNTRDRIMSICMIPFMSCGARLPVYALLAVIFFPKSASTMVLILYLLGIFVAILTGFVLKFTLLKGEITPFIMEMPVYRMPTLRSMLILTWQRLKSFIIGAGKVVVIMITILSLLNSIGTDGTFGHENSDHSVLSVVGKKITPIFEPMGIKEENWPATVGVFTGILAKESVIATLNSLYSMQDAADDDDDESQQEFDFWQGVEEAFATIPTNFVELTNSFLDPLGLSQVDQDIDSLQDDLEVNSGAVSKIESSFGTTGSALAYLIFILLYTPCSVALGAIYREAGAKWMAFVAFWTFFIGWIFATGYYQLTIINDSYAAKYWLIGIITAFIFVVLMMKLIGKMRYFSPSELKNRASLKTCKDSNCCC